MKSLFSGPSAIQRILVLTGLFMASLLLPAQSAQPANSPPAESAPLSLGRLGDLSILNMTFSGASLAEAIQFLEIKTKELDPQKTGLTFLVDDATRALPVRLTFELGNVTVANAIRYLSLMARLEATMVDDAVQLKHSPAIHPPFPSSKASPRVEKRSALVFPSVQFSGASLEEAVAFFQSKGRQLDPANGNVPIIIDPDLTDRKQATVTLNLGNVLLSKALNYSALLAGAEVICLGDALYLQPRK